MFGSFFNMLYPSEKFLTSVLKILKYNPSTYDIAKLNEQMNKNEQCELLNGSIDVNGLNEKLNLKKFILENIIIKKTIFVFKRSYFTEKTVLSFEDINVDIFQKKEEQIEIKDLQINEGQKEQKEKEGSFLDNIINTVIHNVEVNFKNITIRFFDKENKNVDYTILIKGIKYGQNPNEEPIKNDKKMNYLFLHNKSFCIEGILLKEKYDENNNYFFGENGEENKNSFSLKNNNNLFYIKNTIKLDMYFDKDNKSLTFANNNNSEFYIENIFNVQQLNSLIEYFIPKEEKKINENIEIKEIEEKNIEINNKEKNQEPEKTNNNAQKEKGMNLMGFKIEKFNLDLKIWILYFLLIENNKENEEMKDKLWISHEEKPKDNIIEHFNYFQKQYYIFFINDFSLISKNNKISINNLQFKLIDSQKKIEYNYIDIIKFNLDLEKKELIYDNLSFQIGYNILFLLKKYMRPRYKQKKVVHENIEIKKDEDNKENKVPNEKKDISKEEDNNENIINTNSNQIEEKKLFKVKGQNLNIKLFINKNKEVKNEDTITFNDILFPDKEQNYFIEFCINNLQVNQENDSLFSYEKINLTYNEENKNCPILKIIEKEKNDIKINQNEISIDLKNQINLFINSIIIKNIIDYVKTFSQIFHRNIINNKKEVNIKYDNSNNSNINYNNIENECKKNLSFKLKEIQIFLIENEKTHFEIEKILSDLPKNEIDNEINNYLCISLKDIGAKYENNENDRKGSLYLKSLIIQDNIKSSKYKILFSNYNFKNEEEILINCVFDIKKNINLNYYEINPSITISSFVIYLDLFTLYYLYKMFYQFKDKKNVIKKENIHVNNEEKKQIINNNYNKYMINNVKIDYFFMELNYNNNNEVKDDEFLNNSIIKKLISLNNLQLDFNEYKRENINLAPKEAFNEIYKFYLDDILKQIKGGSFAPAIPGLNQISSVIGGIQDIVKKPIQNYKNNESVTEGFISGISSLVVKTTTMITYFGESFINLFGCISNEIQDKDNFCRNYRHNINQKNKEIEEYYFK